jgi:Tfp pilus assembly protein PilV
MNSRRAGYSLFEVLIAFAIMTMVLTALIPGQARLLSRATDQGARFLAQDYAYSRMAKIGVTAPMQEGTLTDSYRNWQITKDISETTLDDLDIRLYRVSISVRNRDGTLLADIQALRVIP